MPRSRRYRKSQNKTKTEWGKNNPQTKAKNRKKLIIIGAIVAVIVVIGAVFAFVPNGLFANPSSSPSPSASPTATPSPTPLPTLAPAATFPTDQYSTNGTQVLLVTSMGDIIVQMRDDKPITTQNFVNLVEQGVYDGTVFHRVMEDFMIQGGMNQTANVAKISDEIGKGNRNVAGTIAMAKTSSPNSATSQFFINVVDNGNNVIDQEGTKFDEVYTVFGQVISGMDVVMNISQVPVTSNTSGENSQPVDTITLISAHVLN
ncbi:MAG: peptidylprolyl isomerase [Candidatus Bathyarchaeota archaeon]|nr:peptidylprolyl isomerase [Candidatus Bathyarchaeota archaeon]